jgi:hypothetical protein
MTGDGRGAPPAGQHTSPGAVPGADPSTHPAAGAHAVDGERPRRPGRRVERPVGRRRVWWSAFALLTALGTLWALADPLFSVPDEPAHVVYAAAAVRGELFADTVGIDTTVSVPATYAAANTTPECFRYDATVPAGCAPPFAAVEGSADVVTTAGRYPPAYYAVVGLATVVADGADAVYLMRVLTVLMCAALLASAVSSARDARSPWAVTGVLLACTPMVLFFSGAVNPQGPEIAAGIALWSSAMVLFAPRPPSGADADVVPGTRARDVRSWPPRTLARLLTASAVLAVIRPMSIVWLALVVGCVVLARASWPTVRELLRRPAAVGGVLGVGALVAFTGVWVLLRDSLAQWSRPSDAPFDAAALFSVSKLDGELHEMVGVFGWLDTWSPGIVYVIWFGAVGTLVVLALAVGTRRERWALAAVVLLSLVVPVASELSSYRESSFAWQGRYILAFSAGLVVVSGHVIAGRLPADLGSRVCRGLVWAIALAQVTAFVGNLNRYVHGVNGFWFIDPAQWRPPVPVAVLVGAHLLVVVVAALALRRLLGQPELPATPAAGPGLPARVDA